MSDLNIKILGLIREGKSINEILDVLKIGKKRLMLQLKKIVSEGYDFNKNVKPNGSICIDLKKDINSFFINVCLEQEENLRVIFISDLHLGRKKDRLDYLDSVYNYAVKNNIGIIVNLGDVVENVYHLPEKQLAKKTIEDQVEHVIKNYPFDKSIANLILYGNHDLYSFSNYGLNIGKLIETNRYDLISLGYMNIRLLLKKDSLCLTHGISDSLYSNTNSRAIFSGHSHKTKNNFSKGHTTFFVPALSDAIPSNYEYKPLKGFLDVTFTFKDELISKVYVKQQIIHYGIHQASESNVKVR